MPDLGNALKIIWPAAWTAAEEQSRQAAEERVSMARHGEAEGLATAETAAEEHTTAAETRTAQLERQLAEANTALDRALDLA